MASFHFPNMLSSYDAGAAGNRKEFRIYCLSESVKTFRVVFARHQEPLSSVMVYKCNYQHVSSVGEEVAIVSISPLSYIFLVSSTRLESKITSRSKCTTTSVRAAVCLALSEGYFVRFDVERSDDVVQKSVTSEEEVSKCV